MKRRPMRGMRTWNEQQDNRTDEILPARFQSFDFALDDTLVYPLLLIAPLPLLPPAGFQARNVLNTSVSVLCGLRNKCFPKSCGDRIDLNGFVAGRKQVDDYVLAAVVHFWRIELAE